MSSAPMAPPEETPDMGPHADMEVNPTDECEKQFYQRKVKRGKKTVKVSQKSRK